MVAEVSPSKSGAGRLAAENLDLRLKLIETRERWRAINHHDQLEPDSTFIPPQKQHRIDPLEDSRNRRLLLEHLEMCRAIAASLPWRAVGLITSPFSRPLENPTTKLTPETVEAIEDLFDIRRSLDETGEFLVRVLNSRKWRLIQRARSIFGRQW